MHRLPAAALACAALVALSGAGEAATRGGPATAGYVVVLQDAIADVDAAIDDLGRSLGAQPTHRYRYALKGFAAQLTDLQAAAARDDPRVDFVSVDLPVHAAGSVPIETGETVPDGLRRIEAAVGDRIQKPSAWAVAVIDTGIDLDHPDLRARHGIDCIDRQTSADDDHGHGTHVAGTVAALNQGDGVVGASPGTLVYAVKSLNRHGFGSRAAVICGMDWVAHNAVRLGIRVVNMSFVGFGRDDRDCGNRAGNPEHRAVCGLAAVGVVPVAAAGNSGRNFSRNSPATYGEVLAVTAMADTDGRPGGRGQACRRTPDDRFASFSSFAAPGSSDAEHTVAAPGVCVRSTRLGGGPLLRLSGTSMASPHVAGAVANCLGHAGAPGPCAALSPAEIVARIRADAAAKPESYGFKGDPAHPPPPKHYYGFLVSDGDY